MSNSEDDDADRGRLQRALDALADDLDAIERRPHLWLRQCAAAPVNKTRGIEEFVDNFARAIERATSGN